MQVILTHVGIQPGYPVWSMCTTNMNQKGVLNPFSPWALLRYPVTELWNLRKPRAQRLPLFYDKYIVRMRNSLLGIGEVNALPPARLIIWRALCSFKFMVSVRWKFLHHTLLISVNPKEGWNSWRGQNGRANRSARPPAASAHPTLAAAPLVHHSFDYPSKCSQYTSHHI